MKIGLIEQFNQEMKEATLVELRELHKKYLGKKGIVRQKLAGLSKVDPGERKAVAQHLNAVRTHIERALGEAIENAERLELEAKLQSEWLDLSLPGLVNKRGLRHPLSEVEDRCLTVLRQLGFSLVDGPEVETAFHNFGVY